MLNGRSRFGNNHLAGCRVRPAGPVAGQPTGARPWPTRYQASGLRARGRPAGATREPAPVQPATCVVIPNRVPLSR